MPFLKRAITYLVIFSHLLSSQLMAVKSLVEYNPDLTFRGEDGMRRCSRLMPSDDNSCAFWGLLTSAINPSEVDEISGTLLRVAGARELLKNAKDETVRRLVAPEIKAAIIGADPEVVPIFQSQGTLSPLSKAYWTTSDALDESARGLNAVLKTTKSAAELLDQDASAQDPRFTTLRQAWEAHKAANEALLEWAAQEDVYRAFVEHFVAKPGVMIGTIMGQTGTLDALARVFGINFRIYQENGAPSRRWERSLKLVHEFCVGPDAETVELLHTKHPVVEDGVPKNPASPNHFNRLEREDRMFTRDIVPRTTVALAANPDNRFPIRLDYFPVGIVDYCLGESVVAQAFLAPGKVQFQSEATHNFLLEGLQTGLLVMDVKGGVVVQGNVSVEGAFLSGDFLTLLATGRFENTGNLALNVKNMTTHEGSTLTIGGGALLDVTNRLFNAGTCAVVGDVSLSVPTLQNLGTLSARSLRAQGEKIDNSGTLKTSSGLTLAISGEVANRGSVEVQDACLVTDCASLRNVASWIVHGDCQVGRAGHWLNQRGGRWEVDGILHGQVQRLTSEGLIRAGTAAFLGAREYATFDGVVQGPIVQIDNQGFITCHPATCFDVTHYLGLKAHGWIDFEGDVLDRPMTTKESKRTVSEREKALRAKTPRGIFFQSTNGIKKAGKVISEHGSVSLTAKGQLRHLGRTEAGFQSHNVLAMEASHLIVEPGSFLRAVTAEFMATEMLQQRGTVEADALRMKAPTVIQGGTLDVQGVLELNGDTVTAQKTSVMRARNAILKAKQKLDHQGTLTVEEQAIMDSKAVELGQTSKVQAKNAVLGHEIEMEDGRIKFKPSETVKQKGEMAVGESLMVEAKVLENDGSVKAKTAQLKATETLRQRGTLDVDELLLRAKFLENYGSITARNAQFNADRWWWNRGSVDVRDSLTVDALASFNIGGRIAAKNLTIHAGLDLNFCGMYQAQNLRVSALVGLSPLGLYVPKLGSFEDLGTKENLWNTAHCLATTFLPTGLRTGYMAGRALYSLPGMVKQGKHLWQRVQERQDNWGISDWMPIICGTKDLALTAIQTASILKGAYNRIDDYRQQREGARNLYDVGRDVTGIDFRHFKDENFRTGFSKAFLPEGLNMGIADTFVSGASALATACGYHYSRDTLFDFNGGLTLGVNGYSRSIWNVNAGASLFVGNYTMDTVYGSNFGVLGGTNMNVHATESYTSMGRGAHLLGIRGSVESKRVNLGGTSTMARQFSVRGQDVRLKKGADVRVGWGLARVDADRLKAEAGSSVTGKTVEAKAKEQATCAGTMKGREGTLIKAAGVVLQTGADIQAQGGRAAVVADRVTTEAGSKVSGETAVIEGKEKAVHGGTLEGRSSAVLQAKEVHTQKGSLVEVTKSGNARIVGSSGAQTGEGEKKSLVMDGKVTHGGTLRANGQVIDPQSVSQNPEGQRVAAKAPDCQVAPPPTPQSFAGILAKSVTLQDSARVDGRDASIIAEKIEGSVGAEIATKDGVYLQTACLDHQGKIKGGVHLKMTGDALELHSLGQVDAQGGRVYYDGPLRTQGQAHPLPTVDEMAEGRGAWGSITGARLIGVDAGKQHVDFMDRHRVAHAFDLKTQGTIRLYDSFTSTQFLSFYAGQAFTNYSALSAGSHVSVDAVQIYNLSQGSVDYQKAPPSVRSLDDASIHGTHVFLNAREGDIRNAGGAIEASVLLKAWAKGDVLNIHNEHTRQGRYDTEKEYQHAIFRGGSGEEYTFTNPDGTTQTLRVGLDCHVEGKITGSGVILGSDVNNILFGRKGVEFSTPYHTYVADKTCENAPYASSWFIVQMFQDVSGTRDVVTKDVVRTALFQNQILSGNGRTYIEAPEGGVTLPAVFSMCRDGLRIDCRDDIVAEGLVIDQTVRSVSENSWRTKHPEISHQTVTIPSVFIDQKGSDFVSRQGDIRFKGFKFQSGGTLSFDAENVYFGSRMLKRSECGSSITVDVQHFGKPFLDACAVGEGRMEALFSLDPTAVALYHCSQKSNFWERCAQGAQAGVSLINFASSMAHGACNDSLAGELWQRYGLGGADGFNPSVAVTSNFTSFCNNSTIPDSSSMQCQALEVHGRKSVTMDGPLPIHVKGPARIQTPKWIQTGATGKGHRSLDNVYLSVGANVTGVTSIGVGASSFREDTTTVYPQTFLVDGQLQVDVDEWLMDAAQTRAGDIAGSVGKMTIQSRQDTVDRESYSLGFSTSGFVHYKTDSSQSAITNVRSGLHVEGGIDPQKFRVGQAHLVGGDVTSGGFNGFKPDQLTAETIRDFRKQRGGGFAGILPFTSQTSEERAWSLPIQTVDLPIAYEEYESVQRNVVGGPKGILVADLPAGCTSDAAQSVNVVRSASFRASIPIPVVSMAGLKETANDLQTLMQRVFPQKKPGDLTQHTLPAPSSMLVAPETDGTLLDLKQESDLQLSGQATNVSIKVGQEPELKEGYFPGEPRLKDTLLQNTKKYVGEKLTNAKASIDEEYQSALELQKYCLEQYGYIPEWAEAEGLMLLKGFSEAPVECVAPALKAVKLTAAACASSVHLAKELGSLACSTFISPHIAHESGKVAANLAVSLGANKRLAQDIGDITYLITDSFCKSVTKDIAGRVPKIMDLNYTNAPFVEIFDKTKCLRVLTDSKESFQYGFETFVYKPFVAPSMRKGVLVGILLASNTSPHTIIIR